MNIMVLRLVIAFLQLALLHSWCPSHGHSRALLHLSGRPSSAYRHSTKIELSAGGFGGQSQSESSKKKKGNSDRKLKPKQQWDRYLDMKNEKRYRVAVKVADDDEWLEVGTVKSQDDKYTEFAVARQRALIVEVRLSRGTPINVLSLPHIFFRCSMPDDFFRCRSR